MTTSTQSDGADPSTPGRTKKRRKKKKRKAEQTAAPAAVETTLPRESIGRAVVFLLISVGAAVFYVKTSSNDSMQPYALVAVGVAAFLAGASPGVEPQRSVAVFGGLVAIGLAVIGIRASEIGTVLAMGGGLGLAGSIHRLGRLGPDEGTSPERPAATGS